MEQITLNEYRKIIHEELEKCGIKVPVELKFDYSCITGTENLSKTKKFIRLCKGNWMNSIYVSKDGERYGDDRYFDLLFVVDENGYPVCIPVPLARTLFNDKSINQSACHRGCMSGYLYEYIYKAYYNKCELPF